MEEEEEEEEEEGRNWKLEERKRSRKKISNPYVNLILLYC